jgi:hypothetical protein
MTRIKITLIVLSFITITFKAQTSDSILGKWKFKGIYNAEKIDSTSLKMLNTLFSNLSIYLKPNNHYNYFFMVKEEEGSWSFDRNTKKLTMLANKGTESQLEIIQVTSKTLILSIGNGKSFILEKVPIEEADNVEEAINTSQPVSASIDQICKKWFICKRYIPSRTSEELEMITDIVSGAYFNFNKNASYQSEIFNIKTIGTWQFGQNNTSLILETNTAKVFWRIKHITENELILIRGNTEEVWTLCIK